MNLIINKDCIQIDNSSIVWNAYEFLNSKEVQHNIINSLPKGTFKLKQSHLPQKETLAILEILTSSHSITTKKNYTKMPSLHAVIALLIIVNISGFILKYYNLSQKQKQLTYHQHQLILEKKKQRKSQKEAKEINTFIANRTQTLLNAKIPIVSLSITPTHTRLIIPKRSTQSWARHLKQHDTQHITNTEITETDTESLTITIHHDVS
jgi:hypothetical protein